MSRKLSIALTRIFYGLFALCFGWVLFSCVFLNSMYPYTSWVSFLLMLLFCGIFLLAYRLLCRHPGTWQKYGAFLCGAAVFITGAVQLANGFAMRYDPAYDLDAIFGGGIAWAENGTLAGSEHYLQYFHMFPDNLGGTFLFRCVFGLARLVGITDYFAVALVFNVFLLQASLVLCYDILRRTAGHTAAVLGLLVFLAFPPFYMMGPVFYTDILSMAAPALALNLYLIARKQPKTGIKCLLYALLGLAVAVGAVVKFTVTIALVAVGIATLLAPLSPRRTRFTWGHFAKTTLLPLLAAVAAFALVLTAWRVFVKENTLDAARLEKASMPFSHWVAMGLIGNGGYDEADYDRAMKLPNRTARDAVNKELIATRLTQPGPVDLAKLFTRKSIRCFGDGTYDLAIFLDDGPHRRAPVHELVLFDGQYYPLYSQLSQGLYLALLALGLAPAVQAALWPKRGWRALRCPAPWLCLFGLFLFLMLWETNSRYTLNYMPVLVVCACLGAAWLRWPRRRAQKVRINKREAVG